jgi:hypothetical protein
MYLKNFYLSTYSSDELGKEINDNATFVGLLNELYSGKDIYNYIGVADSVIRERLFQELSEILNVDYEYIYQLWLTIKTDRQ